MIDVETITYDAETQLQFDLYIPQKSHPTRKPLICFVHGGAWRSEDKLDHAQLAHNLVIATSFPVAVPNYRLSTDHPVFLHPAHAQDILQFLNYTLSHPSPVFDSGNLILIGHSCSAHMLSSIFLDSSAITPSLSPSPELLHSVKAIIMSEGIYDLDTLIANFPNYREWFIQPAFGISESYPQFSVLKYPARSQFSWLLLHSKGDTFVDQIQTDTMYDHLSQIFPHKVSRNVDDLVEQHDDILRGDRYIELISQFTTKY